MQICGGFRTHSVWVPQNPISKTSGICGIFRDSPKTAFNQTISTVFVSRKTLGNFAPHRTSIHHNHIQPFASQHPQPVPVVGGAPSNLDRSPPEPNLHHRRSSFCPGPIPTRLPPSTTAVEIFPGQNRCDPASPAGGGAGRAARLQEHCNSGIHSDFWTEPDS